MVKLKAFSAGVLALGGLLLVQPAPPAEAALCVARSGRLSMRDQCRPSEHTVDGNAIGVDGPAFSAYHNEDLYVLQYQGDGPMLTLDVTEPGDYVIVAKSKSRSDNPGYAHVNCGIKAGGDYDEAAASLSNGIEEMISLNMVHHFSSAGQVEFKCVATGDNVKVNWIKVTAFKVGELSNLNTPVGPDYYPPIR